MALSPGWCDSETAVVADDGKFHRGKPMEAAIIGFAGRASSLPAQMQSMQRRSAAGFEIGLIPHSNVQLSLLNWKGSDSGRPDGGP
jgi:hypothetical protein